jgi:hypothetical protein
MGRIGESGNLRPAPPPSTVDVDRVIQRQRRVARWRAAAVAVTVAAVAAVSAAAATVARWP